MIIESFAKVDGHKSIVAKFNVKLTSGLIIRDVRLITGNNGRWVSWPSRTYKDKDGKDKYFDYIAFDTKERKADLEKLVKESVDKMIAPDLKQNEEIPF